MRMPPPGPPLGGLALAPTGGAPIVGGGAPGIGGGRPTPGGGAICPCGGGPRFWPGGAPRPPAPGPVGGMAPPRPGPIATWGRFGGPPPPRPGWPRPPPPAPPPPGWAVRLIGAPCWLAKPASICEMLGPGAPIPGMAPMCWPPPWGIVGVNAMSLLLQLEMRPVEKTLPVAAPNDPDFDRLGRLFHMIGHRVETLGVVPVERIGRAVHSQRWRLVVLARRVFQLRLAFLVSFVLIRFVAMAANHGEIEGLDRLVRDLLQVGMAGRQIVQRALAERRHG